MNEHHCSRRRNILLFAFIVFPMLLCGGVVAWFFGRQAAAKNELNARIEDLSQRGEPFDNESMQLLYEVGTSDENTALWVAFGEILDSDVFTESVRDMPFHDAYDQDDNLIVVPRPGEDWPDRKQVDDFLAQWQTELKTLRELGIQEYQRGGKPLRRPIRFESIGTLLPDTQRARAMARLLRLQHAVAMYDGDHQLAYDCIRACLGIERSFDAEPIIISQMVAQAIGMMASGMIQTSLEHDQLSDQQMDAIAADLPTFDQLIERYQWAIKGERGLLLPIFHDPEQAQYALNDATPLGVSFMTKTRSRDAVYFLDKFDAMLNLPHDNPAEFRLALQQFSNKLQSEFADSGVLEQMDRMITYNMLPAVGSYGEVYVRRNEINNLAKLAMAVRKYQHQFNRWPQTMDELSKVGVEAKTLKPAVDQPFGYRIEANGEVLLWGVERSNLQLIGKDPPPTDGLENEQNIKWVWRLRP